MGKASSSKKVARAAGTGGGRTNRSSTPWTFVGLIGLIVVVGLTFTFTSRHRAEVRKTAAQNTNAAAAPTIGGTAWDEGLGIYICGKFEPPIKVTSDPEGITTAGNGVIHIAPKVKAAAGKNATLGELAKSTGFKVTASEITLRSGKTYTNGDDCSGRASQVYVKQYPYAGAVVGTVLTQDPPDIPLSDGALLTIAFVPSADKSKIPAPPSYVAANLKKATAPTTTTLPATTVPAGATTTVPAGATTVPAGGATTVPPSSGTTTATTGTSTSAPGTATTPGAPVTTAGSSSSTTS